MSASPSNTPFSCFDARQWGLVYDHRRQAGLTRNARCGRPLTDHPLVGKLIELEARGYYIVKEVREDWWRGWYLMAFLETPGGSHRVCPIENVACHDPSTLNKIEEFRMLHKIIPDVPMKNSNQRW